MSLAVTLNAVPSGYNSLLIVPPSGFTVDVTFTGSSQIVPGTLEIWASPFDYGRPARNLTGALVVIDANGAVALVPAESALPVGSYTLQVRARLTWDVDSLASLPFAVREHPLSPPLDPPQWIQLDFDADRDGDAAPDLLGDLAVFGLGSASAPAASLAVRDWVVTEVVARVQEFYDTPNPSGLPGGDLPDITFSDQPPPSGPFTRICVGGRDPTGGTTIGNVLYDGGNANPSNVACDDFLPSGVFPRELLYYQSAQVFRDVFDPLMADPVSAQSLDATVLGPAYDPLDPYQLHRFQTIETGVMAFAQAVATVSAHEAGHALGMVAPGSPGGGLFGDASGLEFTHNVDPSDATPDESFLMNAGSSFSFSDLIGAAGGSLPRIRELNFAYLQGRLVLDAAVTGIHMAPSISTVAPTAISKSEAFMVEITVLGENFRATPQLRMLGPLVHQLSYTTFESRTQVRGTAMVGMLAEGIYDLEVSNPDGQVALLPGAVRIVP